VIVSTFLGRKASRTLKAAIANPLNQKQRERPTRGDDRNEN
jgi:hypothetical protein